MNHANHADRDNGGNPVDADLTPAELAAQRLDEQMIRRALRQVIDPELGLNIVDLGLIYELGVGDGNDVFVEMTLTTPGCPLSLYLEDEINHALGRFEHIGGVDVDVVFEPAWNADMMSNAAKAQLGWR